MPVISWKRLQLAFMDVYGPAERWRQLLVKVGFWLAVLGVGTLAHLSPKEMLPPNPAARALWIFLILYGIALGVRAAYRLRGELDDIVVGKRPRIEGPLRLVSSLPEVPEENARQASVSERLAMEMECLSELRGGSILARFSGAVLANMSHAEFFDGRHRQQLACTSVYEGEVRIDLGKHVLQEGQRLKFIVYSRLAVFPVNLVRLAPKQ